MAADGVNAAVLQNDDLVRVEHRGDPLGDDDFGCAGQALGQALADFRLSGRVHGAGGIVQNQDLGRF